jgi:hypothetical protein
MTRPENPSLYDQYAIIVCLYCSQHVWRDLGLSDAEEDAAQTAWIERQDQEELKLYINEVMVDPNQPMHKFAAWRA